MNRIRDIENGHEEKEKGVLGIQQGRGIVDDKEINTNIILIHFLY